MTLEKANEIINSAKYHGDMTPLEEALLTLVMDLQVRIALLRLAQ